MNRPPSRPAIGAAFAQEQFLTVLSREEAVRRFDEALAGITLGDEEVALARALDRVVASDIASEADVPPFDRAVVDGFAARAADLAGASDDHPVILRLNGEIVACGTVPALTVAPGTATPIATGGPLPRGADAVVMIEHTEPSGAARTDAIAVGRPAAAGQNIAAAGSDMVRGEVLLRRGTLVGSREIGMLAACGIGRLTVRRRPRVAVLSTGDELVAPGRELAPAAIYDSNGPIIAAAVTEEGGEAVFRGIVPDDEDALRAAIRAALADCDALILSGGTSKGAGDLTTRLIAELGPPGVVAHGVALKPGKPLCLAVCGAKPVVVLPGFPTSAMFTFHDIVAPVLRRLAGLPPRARATMAATVPLRVPSELGRTEFVMVSLVEGETGLLAYPLGKGSGAVTAFSQADGYVTVEALADAVPAGTRTDVTLFTPHLRVPDLTIIGSHDVGLERLVGRLAAQGFTARVMALGSLGGLAAAKRGECDLAPIHLMDAATGVYNLSFLSPGLTLVKGWRRMQGLVFRRGDPHFAGDDPQAAVAAALADPACHIVNRNAGAGTRILIDRLLGAARPDGYWNQPRTHNAVAAAIAQGRADWGVAITPVARSYGLGFLPLGPEHYDFALVESRRDRPAVRGFLECLAEPGFRQELRDLGFEPDPS